MPCTGSPDQPSPRPYHALPFDDTCAIPSTLGSDYSSAPARTPWSTPRTTSEGHISSVTRHQVPRRKSKNVLHWIARSVKPKSMPRPASADPWSTPRTTSGGHIYSATQHQVPRRRRTVLCAGSPDQSSPRPSHASSVSSSSPSPVDRWKNCLSPALPSEETLTSLNLKKIAIAQP